MRDDTNLLERLNKKGSKLALLALVGVAPSLTNCYGRFPLTHALYKFNGDISSNGFIQSAVMWLFIWFPVYGFAALGDAVIFNLVEFWTGEQLTIGSVTTKDGSTLTLAPTEDKNVATLTLTRDGQTLSSQKLVRVSNTELQVRDTDDRLAATLVRDDKGHIEVLDGLGFKVSSLDASNAVGRLAMAQ